LKAIAVHKKASLAKRCHDMTRTVAALTQQVNGGANGDLTNVKTAHESNGMTVGGNRTNNALTHQRTTTISQEY
jgi:hypothetical protein